MALESSTLISIHTDLGITEVELEDGGAVYYGKLEIYWIVDTFYQSLNGEGHPRGSRSPGFIYFTRSRLRSLLVSSMSSLDTSGHPVMGAGGKEGEKQLYVFFVAVFNLELLLEVPVEGQEKGIFVSAVHY